MVLILMAMESILITMNEQVNGVLNPVKMPVMMSDLMELVPTILNYTGPDADGTEGKRQNRTIRKELAVNPIFASTDISESDMLGLTSFHYSTDVERVAIIRTDESLFKYMADGKYHDFQSQTVKLYGVFLLPVFSPYIKGELNVCQCLKFILMIRFRD